MTNLRKRMLKELQRRNYSEKTIRGYLRTVEQFAKHFGKSPDKLGPDELRSYQAYLLTERKLAVGSVVGRVAALRFFFVRTLKRREFWGWAKATWNTPCGTPANIASCSAPSCSIRTTRNTGRPAAPRPARSGAASGPWARNSGASSG